MSARSIADLVLGRRAAAVLATSVVALATLVLAPSATAATEHQKDPKGDTTASMLRQAGTLTKQVDVTKVATRYEGSTIEVTVSLVDLAGVDVDPDPGSELAYQYGARVRSDAGDYLISFVITDVGGGATLSPLGGSPAVGAGCDTPSVSFDRGRDRVIFGTKRDCIGAGNTVRTGGVASNFDSAANRGRYDVARRKGGLVVDYTDIPLGPKVERN